MCFVLLVISLSLWQPTKKRSQKRKAKQRKANFNFYRQKTKDNHRFTIKLIYSRSWDFSANFLFVFFFLLFRLFSRREFSFHLFSLWFILEYLSGPVQIYRILFGRPSWRHRADIIYEKRHWEMSWTHVWVTKTKVTFWLSARFCKEIGKYTLICRTLRRIKQISLKFHHFIEWLTMVVVEQFNCWNNGKFVVKHFTNLLTIEWRSICDTWILYQIEHWNALE